MTSHTPVFLEEVLHYLRLSSGKHYVDATADGGGHAIAILKAIQPAGKLLMLEWDDELVDYLKEKLKKECPHFSKNYRLIRSSYTTLARCVRSFGFGPVAGVLFDLGFSSFHLEASRRGFSFQKSEPLDMRYSPAVGPTAAELLARSSQHELENIFKNFGGERFARSIARHIVTTRRERSCRRTTQLVSLIREATPRWYHIRRLHFATRVFQALRIAVNHELENIPRGLANACDILAPGGRIVTITFHSLEDAVVKNFFRQPPFRENFTAVTRKPLRPAKREILVNLRARSAKLRVYEKLS